MQGRKSAVKRKAETTLPVTQAHEKSKKTAEEKTDIRRSQTEYDLTGRYVFFHEEFERVMERFKNLGQADRLDAVINQCTREEGGTRFLYIYWTSADKHCYPLKITFARGNQLFKDNNTYLADEFFTKMILNVDHPLLLEKERNTSVLIEEVAGHESVRNSANIGEHMKLVRYESGNALLAAMFFTSNYSVGKLRNVAAGLALPLNEIRHIYKAYLRLFTGKNLLEFNETVNADAESIAEIPLRIVSVLASGKFLYEFGKGTIEHQSNQVSLEGLRTLPLDVWHEKLDANRRVVLVMLYKVFLQKRQSGSQLFRASQTVNVEADKFDSATIADLAAAVFADAKARNEITDALRELSGLLCGQAKHDFYQFPREKKEDDYWIKSRLYQLLKNDCFGVLESKSDYLINNDMKLKR